MKSKLIYRHHSLNISELLPVRSWKAAIGQMLLLLLVVLLTEISTAKADGLFDFQMKLAKKGNAEAQFKIGEMYETGFGVKQDMEQSRIWINKAAGKGHVVAGYKLLYWDLQKNGVTEENKDPLQSLKKRAEEEDPQAIYYIGKMSAHGVGLKKNQKKGLELLNKAAFLGVLEAEREAIAVREKIQRAQLAKRRAEQKRKAMLKMKQEQERLKRLEAQRKAEKLKAKKAAEEKRKQAEKQSAEQKAAEQARKEAERLRAERETLEREREARRQALITQRKLREQKRKEQFESDPCAGKSARFLSTCR